MKSWAEISSAALAANYRTVRSACGDGVAVLGVVKANAYGHDAVLCGRVLVEAGATMLGVADVDEAARLRGEGGLAAPAILVMSGIEPGDAPSIVEHRLTPVAWTREQIEALARAAEAADRVIGVHLEIDTGMARQGVWGGAELASLLVHMAAAPRLQLEGLMTHLADSQIERGRYTAQQRGRFAAALDQVLASGLRPKLLHLANSSAIDEGSTLAWLRETCARLGMTPMVRPGISLYGYILPIASDPSERHDEQGEAVLAAGAIAPKLQRVLTWKTRILDVRELAAGEPVGYSRTFTAAAPMRVALLPIGYADGFRRSASSGVGPDWQRGWVMVHGCRAYVVGRVSMNLTVIDVTGISGAATGDEVVLLGDGVTADDHAAWAGTISYEVLCGMRAPLQIR